MVKILYIIIFCSVFFCCRESKLLTPVDIFNVQKNENLTKEQLTLRLQYVRALNPVCSGDSLVVPKATGVPKSYVAYMENFVDTVNYYMKKMTLHERLFVLNSFISQNADTKFLSGYLCLRDSDIELNFSEQDAIDLGIKSDYDEMKLTCVKLNMPLFQNQELAAYKRAITICPRNIFLDTFVFNGVALTKEFVFNNGIVEINDAISRLNANYKKEK